MIYTKRIRIEDILLLLQNRYPFLLIDSVESFNSNDEIIAKKNVTIDEPFFKGHFPGKPVLPGFMLIECFAQATQILILKSVDNLSIGEIKLVSIENTKFKKVVLPGDTLQLHVKITNHSGQKICATCTAIVAEVKVCITELEFKILGKP